MKADRTAAAPQSNAVSAEPIQYVLRLYVAGQTPRSVHSVANIKHICEEYLPGCYKLDVVDLYQQPQLAHDDQIIAVPTLIRKLPQPVHRIIGDLSNTGRVLAGLGLGPKPRDASETARRTGY